MTVARPSNMAVARRYHGSAPVHFKIQCYCWNVFDRMVTGTERDKLYCTDRAAVGDPGLVDGRYGYAAFAGLAAMHELVYRYSRPSLDPRPLVLERA
jgi:hypothetical protein